MGNPSIQSKQTSIVNTGTIDPQKKTLTEKAREDNLAATLSGMTYTSRADFFTNYISSEIKLPGEDTAARKGLLKHIKEFFAGKGETKEISQAEIDGLIAECETLCKEVSKGTGVPVPEIKKQAEAAPINATEITPDVQGETKKTLEAKQDAMQRLQDIQKQISSGKLSPEECLKLQQEAVKIMGGVENLSPVNPVAGLKDIPTDDLKKGFNELQSASGATKAPDGKWNVKNSVEIDDTNKTLKKVKDAVDPTGATTN